MTEEHYLCSDCGDIHGITEREEPDGRLITLCPSCGSQHALDATVEEAENAE